MTRWALAWYYGIKAYVQFVFALRPEVEQAISGLIIGLRFDTEQEGKWSSALIFVAIDLSIQHDVPSYVTSCTVFSRVVCMCGALTFEWNMIMNFVGTWGPTITEKKKIYILERSCKLWSQLEPLGRSDIWHRCALGDPSSSPGSRSFLGPAPLSLSFLLL